MDSAKLKKKWKSLPPEIRVLVSIFLPLGLFLAFAWIYSSFDPQVVAWQKSDAAARQLTISGQRKPDLSWQTDPDPMVRRQDPYRSFQFEGKWYDYSPKTGTFLPRS